MNLIFWWWGGEGGVQNDTWAADLVKWWDVKEEVRHFPEQEQFSFVAVQFEEAQRDWRPTVTTKALLWI